MFTKKMINKLTTISFAVLGSTAAFADNVIENITATQQAGSVVLRVKMKDIPAPPAIFSIQSGAPRIALDFQDTSSNVSRNKLDIGQGRLASVNVVQAGTRSRVILNLKEMTTYHTSVEGNDLILVLEGAESSVKPSLTQGTKTELGPTLASNVKPVSITDLKFRAGTENEALFSIDLSNPNASVNVQRMGSNLLVEFINAKLPPELKDRARDVSQFGTPVGTYKVRESNNRVLVEISPVDKSKNWEHQAYQADNQFVLEVKPLKEANRLSGADRQYRGEKLSLNFQNVDVRAVLQVIADFTNLNIVATESVQGNITLRLKDVPWDQALDIILKAKNLDFRKEGSVLRVAPSQEILNAEKDEQVSKQALEDSAPLIEDRIQLNYTNAIALVKLFKNDGGSGGGGSAGGGGNDGGHSGAAYHFLSKRGIIIGDERTNQIFIKDTAARIDAFRRMVASLDIPVRQVQVEARIVEASEGFGRDLGVKIGFAKYSQGGRENYGGALTPSSSTSSTSLSGMRSTVSPNFLSLPVATNASTLGMSLLSAAGTSLFELELSASEDNKESRVLSRPIVVTQDNQKAIFKDGQKVSFEKATSSGATSIEFQDIVLGLEVIPQITPDGNINLAVEVKKEDLDFYDLTRGARIKTRLVNTRVLVENGGTVILGGSYTQQDDKSVTKTPLLGDIPVVGNLFKRTSVATDKKELLIFITPRILTNAVSDAAGQVVNRSR